MFDNAPSAVDLVDFPVLVVLEPDSIDYDMVADPVRDLRFHDSDTDEDLAFEIDHWDPAGESAVWVRVPRIDAFSVVDSITMELAAAAAAPADASAVWAGSYELVSHLDTIACADATGRGRTGIPTGVSFAPGKIGNGAALTSSGASMIRSASSANRMPT